MANENEVPVTGTELDNMQGEFVDKLLRNNKKIRNDRAIAIAEAAQMKYKRKVEDLQQDLKEMRRERDNMLDLSPTTADSLTLASDFKADDFVAQDIALGVKIREKEIMLEIAQSRYSRLFTNKAE